MKKADEDVGAPGRLQAACYGWAWRKVLNLMYSQ